MYATVVELLEGQRRMEANFERMEANMRAVMSHLEVAKLEAVPEPEDA